MPTDPFPHLRHDRPELQLGAAAKQKLSELLRLDDPDGPELRALISEADASVYNY